MGLENGFDTFLVASDFDATSQDLIGRLQDISEFLEDDDLEGDSLEDDGYLIGHLQNFMIIFKIYRPSSRNFYTSV